MGEAAPTNGDLGGPQKIYVLAEVPALADGLPPELIFQAAVATADEYRASIESAEEPLQSVNDSMVRAEGTVERKVQERVEGEVRPEQRPRSRRTPAAAPAVLATPPAAAPVAAPTQCTSTWVEADAGDYWCGKTHNEGDYEASDIARVADLGLGKMAFHAKTQSGWRICNTHYANCKRACDELFGCAEIVMTTNGKCCFLGSVHCEGNMRKRDVKYLKETTGCSPPAASPPAASPPPAGEALCRNTCEFKNDKDCDDGGPGNDYESCDLGTDCNDCGPRPLPSPPPAAMDLLDVSRPRVRVRSRRGSSEGTSSTTRGSTRSSSRCRTGAAGPSAAGRSSASAGC